MAKLDVFDLDIKVKTDSKSGVHPSGTTKFICTPGCITGWVMTCNSNGCK